MTNIYWPVYKNLESIIIKLSYSIYINDEQINVYSSSISDLILRASAEIESISKELYKSYGGKKTKNIKYDSDALDFLIQLWKLERKTVIINSPNCFQSKRQLKPFVKNETSNFHGKLTFTWNNSYQNLKHDRANSLKFGSLKYLFDIMAALFILNIYYKDEDYKLEKWDRKALNFPLNLGSELFSIKLHKWISYDAKHNYGKTEDFDECLYLTRYTDESLKQNEEAVSEMMEKQRELFLKHPKFHKFLESNNIKDYQGKNLMFDVLGKKDYFNIIQIANQRHLEVLQKTEYEAVLNKNNI